jgi:hypothetical protein
MELRANVLSASSTIQRLHATTKRYHQRLIKLPLGLHSLHQIGLDTVAVQTPGDFSGILFWRRASTDKTGLSITFTSETMRVHADRSNREQVLTIVNRHPKSAAHDGLGPNSQPIKIVGTLGIKLTGYGIRPHNG